MTDFNEEFLNETIATALGDELNYHVPKGIARYDYANAHGWWVRMHRDEEPFQKMFWDAHYSDISEALRAAIEHRHKILVNHPIKTKTKIRKFKEISSTPEERIFLIEKGNTKHWLCTWYDENHKPRKKQFAVNKYGVKESKALALAHTIANHNKVPKPPVHMRVPDPYAKQSFKTVSREDVGVLSTIDSGTYKGKSVVEAAVEASVPMAFEGGRKLAIHMKIERDRKLRDEKVKVFLENNGTIFCEVCKFRFTERYPFLQSDLIEVHHIAPLHTLSEKSSVRLNDLMLLCPNCHTAVHQGDEETNLLLAMDLFESNEHNH